MDDSRERRGLLFLCVANSSRSQMAEGFARQMAPADVPVHSAGSEPTRVNPFAILAMKEVGIDISAQSSKSIDQIDKDRIGTVITLCAEEVCPIFPVPVQQHHWPFEDPAAATGHDEERLAAFRRIRDQIETRMRAYFERSG